MSDQCSAAGTGGSIAVCEENLERYVHMDDREAMFNALPEDIRLAWERIAAHLNETIPEMDIDDDTCLCPHVDPWQLREAMDKASGIAYGEKATVALAMFAGVDFNAVTRNLTQEERDEFVQAEKRREKAIRKYRRQFRKRAKEMVA